MLQTLFLIPAQVAGYPVFGFGLLLGLWAIASVGLMAWLVRRQGFNADTRGYVPIILLLGAIIAWLLPAICEKTPEGAPIGLAIRGYGVMILLAVVAGTALAAWRAKRRGLDPEMVFSLVIWMIVPGIICARAFYVIQFWQAEYYGPAYAAAGGSALKLIGEVLNVTKGGLVVYGAFLGGVIGILAFVRKHRLPLLAICDLMAPSMVLGLAIGRIGCLLNGCCFGDVCDHAWAITFPADSIPYQAQVERGQMYGMRLSSNPETAPRLLAVVRKSPADIAGLREDDLLRSINGYTISTSGDAFAAISQAFRRGAPLEIKAELGAAMRTSVQHLRTTFTVPAISAPPRSLPVHPAQIYSVLDGLLVCLILLGYSRYQRRDGEVFALMLTISPVTRFLIEMVRSDEAAVFGTGMTIAQNVSLALLVAAAVLWCYVLSRPQGLAFRQSGSDR